MSIQAVSWCFDQTIPDPGAKLVLMSLCNAHNRDTGRCNPSITTLALESSLSAATVRRKLTWLEENGWIRKSENYSESGRQTTNIYYLEMEYGEGVTVTGGGVTADRGEGVTVDRGNMNRNKEPIKRKNTKKEKLISILSKAVPYETAIAVVEHRQAIKKPLTDRAAELLANEFLKTGSPDRAANTMIMNGWQGFKADWLNNRDGRTNSHEMIDALAAEAARRSG